MNLEKELLIKEIAGLIALAVLWGLVLVHSATIEEVSKLILLGLQSMTLPFLTKELVGFLLRIRLVP